MQLEFFKVEGARISCNALSSALFRKFQHSTEWVLYSRSKNAPSGILAEANCPPASAPAVCSETTSNDLSGWQSCIKVGQEPTNSGSVYHLCHLCHFCHLCRLPFAVLGMDSYGFPIFAAWLGALARRRTSRAWLAWDIPGYMPMPSQSWFLDQAELCMLALLLLLEKHAELCPWRWSSEC